MMFANGNKWTDALIFAEVVICTFVCVYLSAKKYIETRLNEERKYYEDLIGDIHTEMDCEIEKKLGKFSEAIKNRADANWDYAVDLDSRISKLEKRMRRNYRKLDQSISDSALRLGNEIDEMYRENCMDGYFMNLISDKLNASIDKAITHNDMAEDRFKLLEERISDLQARTKTDVELMEARTQELENKFLTNYLRCDWEDYEEEEDEEEEDEEEEEEYDEEDDDKRERVITKKIVHEGKTYLKCKLSGAIYDYDEWTKNQEAVEIGKWNENTNTIEFA
jgi:hypothetical protein